MNLIFFMLVSASLALLLLPAGPTLGSFFAFVILAGCLFRALYLLNKINDKLSRISNRVVHAPQAVKESEGKVMGGNYISTDQPDGQ
ncbi:hypothetical protein ACTL32_06895 [Planococcus sp. FY231025]|uniref:hypothetical protein n=1 Tax=Planococcus sp. FY231025 TaxID=3455699 RepID=UPI003F900354